MEDWIKSQNIRLYWSPCQGKMTVERGTQLDSQGGAYGLRLRQSIWKSNEFLFKEFICIQLPKFSNEIFLFQVYVYNTQKSISKHRPSGFCFLSFACVCLDRPSLCSSGWPRVKKEDSLRLLDCWWPWTQFSCLATQTEESSDRSASAGIKGVLSCLPRFCVFFGTRGSAIH